MADQDEPYKVGGLSGYFGVADGGKGPKLSSFRLSTVYGSEYRFRSDGRIFEYQGDATKRLPDAKAAELSIEFIKNPGFLNHETERRRQQGYNFTKEDFLAFAKKIENNYITGKQSPSLVDESKFSTVNIGGKPIRASFESAYDSENKKVLGNLHLLTPDGLHYTIGKEGRITEFEGDTKMRLPDIKIADFASKVIRHPAFQKEQSQRLKAEGVDVTKHDFHIAAHKIELNYNTRTKDFAPNSTRAP